jgi:hypothetical protein
MLTAITALLLSAIGGGLVGALMTDAYPKDTCTTCDTNKTESYYEENYDEPKNGEYEYTY